MKKILILLSIFISYVLILNILGDYSLMQVVSPFPSSQAQSSGLNQFLSAKDTLTVSVKRARQFCLASYCLLPTYIYLPYKIYFINWNLFIFPEPSEIRVKDFNIIFLALFFVFSVIILFKNKLINLYREKTKEII
jgi:hypothetical protein